MKIISVLIGAIVLFSCHSTRNKEGANKPHLLSDIRKNASYVYLTNDENNSPAISWCEQDTALHTKHFFLSFFNKGNNTFSRPLAVPIEQNANLHEERMPKVAFKSNGTIIAVYETSAPTKQNGWAGFIHYIQSSDKGNTWTQPLCVHSDTSAGKNHSYASIARLGDGEIGACWLDASLNPKKEGRSVVFAKTSGSNGFGQQVLIDSIACECCRTAISSNTLGKISIVFRNIIRDSIRDISVSTSVDNGKTFSGAISFSNDNWVIKGCPENGPDVASTPQKSYVVWFSGGSERGVHYAVLDSYRNVLSKKYISKNGRFIQLCLLPGNKEILVYSEAVTQAGSGYNKIVMDKVDNDKIVTENITSQKRDASYPVVQKMNDNSVIIAWKQDRKIYYKVVDTNAFANSSQPSAQYVAMQ